METFPYPISLVMRVLKFVGAAFTLAERRPNKIDIGIGTGSGSVVMRCRKCRDAHRDKATNMLSIV